MKRAHGYKHRHCGPELKRTTSYTTVGPAKDNHHIDICLLSKSCFLSFVFVFIFLILLYTLIVDICSKMPSSDCFIESIQCMLKSKIMTKYIYIPSFKEEIYTMGVSIT